MSKSGNEGLVLGLTLLVTLGLAGGGYWLISNSISSQLKTSQTPQPTSSKLKTLEIDGSVTMVALVKRLQLAYAQQNPDLPTTYGVPDGHPNGSNAGIKNLINGSVAMAASSRPLKPQEIQDGLVAVPIARDALAVVVGINNSYKGGLSLEQLQGIFQGKITNWSQVGGANQPIKVINRSPDSGTRTFFKDNVLLGGNFAPDSPNFITLTHDETTPILRALSTNGIGYSTVQQVKYQKTVRMVDINGVSAGDINAVKSGVYPISRVFYLVTKGQPSPEVKQFMEMSLSPSGQQIV